MAGATSEAIVTATAAAGNPFLIGRFLVRSDSPPSRAVAALPRLSRGPAQPPPLWHRILASALLMALFGWLLGLVGVDAPPAAAIISGTLLGLLGLRPLKAALGLVVGLSVGLLFEALSPD